MAYSKIELERDGDVAIIRLNDPATLNAVTLQTIEEIDAALTEIRLCACDDLHRSGARLLFRRTTSGGMGVGAATPAARPTREAASKAT